MAFRIGHQNSLLGGFVQAVIFYLAFAERLRPHDLGDAGDSRPVMIESTFTIYYSHGIDHCVEETALPLGELQFAGLFASQYVGFLKIGLEDTKITGVYNPVKFW